MSKLLLTPEEDLYSNQDKITLSNNEANTIRHEVNKLVTLVRIQERLKTLQILQ